ncbi:hypothetical protein [Sulfitobacter guttiformis]|uniref:Uncharacterized protein n=1 Tax=Sulfitobacter guttiformis TaxID=74349 RepID=A0A420DT79_9RHOB|nr:hypothetical protein [Sulfitobacter guttiformis]KIN74884.1 hypothetical protein Z949_4090 [Sulfitobacter guttiformis KCTC 32187]RKE97452.1 hypothetical protein C8N30_2056 [Sulfitobacter guttiformis]
MEFQKENSLARVSYTGGILGLVVGSQFARLEKVIAAKNRDGWNLAEVIPENRNLIIWVFRILLLVVTLGLWTLATGYILVFERQVVRREGEQKINSTRKEPTLAARRPAI